MTINQPLVWKNNDKLKFSGFQLSWFILSFNMLAVFHTFPTPVLPSWTQKSHKTITLTILMNTNTFIVQVFKMLSTILNLGYIVFTLRPFVKFPRNFYNHWWMFICMCICMCIYVAVCLKGMGFLQNFPLACRVHQYIIHSG